MMNKMIKNTKSLKICQVFVLKLHINIIRNIPSQRKAGSPPYPSIGVKYGQFVSTFEHHSGQLLIPTKTDWLLEIVLIFSLSGVIGFSFGRIAEI